MTETYRAYLMTTDKRYIQIAVTRLVGFVYSLCLEGLLIDFASADVVINKVLIYKNEKIFRICHMPDKYLSNGDSFRFVFKTT